MLRIGFQVLWVCCMPTRVFHYQVTLDLKILWCLCTLVKCIWEDTKLLCRHSMLTKAATCNYMIGSSDNIIRVTDPEQDPYATAGTKPQSPFDTPLTTTKWRTSSAATIAPNQTFYPKKSMAFLSCQIFHTIASHPTGHQNLMLSCSA